ncbi:hypothetical protein [Oceanobacter mangrovi]|uniref:hypothetical protein n=1 Tax=Oceanobacter mangrovi TaxID=2862510 RepID=UPI001C8E5BF5|nr:hypothetical protein [Oceanobacter mangrovi]
MSHHFLTNQLTRHLLTLAALLAAMTAGVGELVTELSSISDLSLLDLRSLLSVSEWSVINSLLISALFWILFLERRVPRCFLTFRTLFREPLHGIRRGLESAHSSRAPPLF